MDSKATALNFQLSRSLDQFQMGSGASTSSAPQFSASRIHSNRDLVHSKAVVLNFQLPRSIPDGIWCIQKERFSIFSFLDLFQIGSGYSKAAILNFELLGSIPIGIWYIQKHWSSNFNSLIHSRWDLVHAKATTLNFQLVGAF